MRLRQVRNTQELDFYWLKCSISEMTSLTVSIWRGQFVSSVKSVNSTLVGLIDLNEQIVLKCSCVFFYSWIPPCAIG